LRDRNLFGRQVYVDQRSFGLPMAWFKAGRHLSRFVAFRPEMGNA
jgi:hypothetical protein